jgi:hypothetical protein
MSQDLQLGRPNVLYAGEIDDLAALLTHVDRRFT